MHICNTVFCRTLIARAADVERRDGGLPPDVEYSGLFVSDGDVLFVECSLIVPIFFVVRRLLALLRD